MDSQTKEIRKILLGRTTWTEDGRIAALPQGRHMHFQGVGNGWGAVRLLGIIRRERDYQLSSGDPEKMITEILDGLGRRVYLAEKPKATACLHRYLMAAPVLLVVEREGKRMRVTLYTARGLLTSLNCTRLFKNFEKGLPETVQPLEKEPRAARGAEKKHGQTKKSGKTKTSGKQVAKKPRGKGKKGK